jgi:hypothetical protein
LGQPKFFVKTASDLLYLVDQALNGSLAAAAGPFSFCVSSAVQARLERAGKVD